MATAGVQKNFNRELAVLYPGTTLGSAAINDSKNYVNTASIGNASMAIGMMTQSYGTGSTAIGVNTTDEGDCQHRYRRHGAELGRISLWHVGSRADDLRK